MKTYRVFDQNNVLTEVTDVELDRAASERGPLPTELANAAALADRRDLSPRLYEALAASKRLQKIAAAKALLAFGDSAAVEQLERQASIERDAISANMFRAVALRLRGVSDVRQVFDSEDDPALSGLIASAYNSQLKLTPEDLDFLIHALDSYLTLGRSWIRAMDHDEWSTDVYMLLRALTGDAPRALLGSARLERVRQLLVRVTASAVDDDTKQAAEAALSAL